MKVSFLKSASFAQLGSMSREKEKERQLFSLPFKPTNSYLSILVHAVARVGCLFSSSFPTESGENHSQKDSLLPLFVLVVVVAIDSNFEWNGVHHYFANCFSSQISFQFHPAREQSYFSCEQKIPSILRFITPLDHLINETANAWKSQIESKNKNKKNELSVTLCTPNDLVVN